MTITYTGEVATCRGFGCFLKLLLRWRGSIYKLVWLDLLAFLTIYYAINMVYRFGLNPAQKETFEAIVQYCDSYRELIPLSFVLGFYVSIVMTRWWNQYTSIPWPDPIAVFVSSNVHGQDERGRMMRRTIMRYVCLCLTMVLANVSPRVKKRFPGLNNLVEAGLLNDNEKTIIETMNKAFPRPSKHWLPIVWAASIITRARKEGRIRDDFAVKTIIDELNKFRGQCGLLISYDTISVPLVYTQVVTLAVYSYFLTCCMGQQWTDGKVVGNTTYLNKVDLYFPVFTTLQFFFYMGWLKVAESLINPFGEDDDDFEVNWMVDRNLQVSYLIVDEMHHDHPELLKDQYWDEVFPNELPYTIAAERFRENHPEPSTAKIEVPKNAAMPSTMSSVRIDEMVGNANGDPAADAKAPNPVTGQVQVPVADSGVQTVTYDFPKGSLDEEADDASGIHFSAGNGKMRLDSSPSLVSVSGTLSRVNTVASALKRFLSRDDSRPGSATPSQDQPYKFPASASSASLSAAVVGSATSAGKPAGSLRITQQVIEEVDEQATITSMRANEPRPNVMDIFAQTSSGAGTSGPLQPPPAHSEPVDIPSRPPSYNRAQSQYEPNLFPPGGVDALLSTSAPAGGSPLLLSNAATAPSSPVGESSKSLYDPQKAASRETERPDAPQVFRWFVTPVENIDLRSSTDLLGNAAVQPEYEGDDFDKLKAEREKEKLMRQQKNLARTISTAPGMEATAVPMVPMVPVNVAVQQAQLQPVASSADLLAGGDQFSNSTMKSEDAINGS
ncbi:bestrophin-2 isoform X1 [Drosophila sechellia]|uniref:bestrophin-2 isoform X1 n=1 Tax=Drosophila sechellia TaxID=7238 RepID=UPI0013DE3B59|nr:bestrophin-2 isoform X1 [Drosophila sechellia]XP_032576994.1 bestrophin-2 isoform X1 [Drosophila sechellia]XP_032576995.1 bestrophin-2 isoform X1 [Drosophila sechellia]XP_032576996.1 bestrophin-2 isoform X1 [Drosophila sechellia]